ncbi:MAG: excinuclease ABC subunit UvrC [Clostridiales Family XIII bacterium]|jgi:excinuclease ABC subunit C|nr:excinuclease ABC subunit UvrC [Clostridiales Family XIII bacterium]
MFDIEENLKTIPDKPGVYLHKDKYGEIIYVGKAVSLKKRVRQYFRPGRNVDVKTAALASHIAEFEYIVTKTEMEALLLENTLIKRHMPRYNVMLRDDKTYPYIKITLKEPFPRILKTRVLKNDGSKYFGPYADVGAVNRIVGLLGDIYRLKRCSMTEFPPGHRPCLNGHIGKCRIVCTGEPDRDAYLSDIEAVISFLKGRNSDVIDYLKRRMKEASDLLDFETAAKWRDYILAAKAVTEKQRVELLSSGNMDIVLATAPNENGMAQITVFFVRDGRLVGREIHHLDATQDSTKEEIVSAFLSQYYVNQTIVPGEILVEAAIPDEALITAMLSDIRGSVVRIFVPERGKKRELLKLAQGDVSESSRHMEDRIQSSREKEQALETELNAVITAARETEGDGSYALDAKTPELSPCPPCRPLRLEAYDISNTGGTDSVGAMVVFELAKPVKADYRKFRIRSDAKGDDYAAMQEVLYRRLRHGLAKDKGFEKMPDLILIDGGTGHVHAALQVIGALGVPLAVAGMVKDDRHRTRGLIVADAEIDLKESPALFHLIGQIQEEVHRFAIEYHRGVRSSAAIRSELDEISGIGAKRRNALLLRFGSIDAIRTATEEELSQTPGMNAAAAHSVRTFFENSPN